VAQTESKTGLMKIYTKNIHEQKQILTE